jgi:hypothetical protein
MDVLLTFLASYLVFTFAFNYYFFQNAFLSSSEQWGKIWYLFLFTVGPVLLLSFFTKFPLLKTHAANKSNSGNKGFLTFLGYFGVQSIFALTIELLPMNGHNIINDIWYDDKGDYLVFCLIFECVKLAFFALNRLFYFFLNNKPSKPREVHENIVEGWEDIELIELESTIRETQTQNRLHETNSLKQITQKEVQDIEHITK